MFEIILWGGSLDIPKVFRVEELLLEITKTGRRPWGKPRYYGGELHILFVLEPLKDALVLEEDIWTTLFSLAPLTETTWVCFRK